MSLGCANILSANELERYRVRLERTLPVKGKKEFSPSGSWVERKQLEAARDERHALLKEERVERVGTLSVAEWDEKTNIAVVTYSVGKHWENFGHQQGQTKCLHPEEALFLLETSNLLLLHNNVGLSVQQGYNTLLGQRTGCTLNCYRVFSHLARQGFRLKRHAGPVFALTDYERRIGLQSYLYPSRRSVPSVQGQPVDEHGDSASAEGQENTVRQITISEGNDDEIPTNYIDNQHAGNLSESQVKTEALIPQASEEKVFTSSGDEIISNTVKNEDNEAPEFEFSNNNTVENSARVQTDVSVTNFKSGKQHIDPEDRERIASESTSTARSLIDKIKEESILTEMDSDVSMDANDTERIASESIPSTTRLIIDKIKEETIRTGNCDVLLDANARERIASEAKSTRTRLLIDKIKEETIHTGNCDVLLDANARERIASESTSTARLLVDRMKEEMIGTENYNVSLNANDRERIAPESTSTTRLLIDRIKEETIRTGNCDVLLDANARERIASESTSTARLLVDRIKEEMIGTENYDVSLNANARERIAPESTSTTRLLIDRIKEETIRTGNCDVLLDANARERIASEATSTRTSLLIDKIKEETIRTGNCDVLLDANARERIASEATSTRTSLLIDKIKEETIRTGNCDVLLDANARERISSNSASIARLLGDRIKEDSIHTERNCDVSMDSTDSPSIIESVEELQEVDKHLNSREPQILVDSSEIIKENLKTSNEVCLVSDSSVSGFSDIIVDHEEQEQNRNHDKTPRLPPLVNLVSCNENKLRGRESKMSTPQDLVIIDELPVTPRLKMTVGQPSTSNHLPKCDVQITNICSAKENGAALRTKNRKTIGGQKSSIKKSLKCEIDITDGSSAEECMSTCPDITNNKGDDILCIDHKHKPKRKRRISQRRSSVKSEKSYVVDVETDTLMHSDNNLVPRKVAKREKQREISEVIVVDDIDTHSENDEAIVLKDDDLELELIKFYEEITLIDLTGEDSRTQTRAEILDMFPNFAGVTIATVRVPPSELLPENVAPSQQEYQIDLQKLLSDRPDWIVRRRPYRGRGGYQRFRPRRGHFRHQQYQGPPHRHMADERNYVDSHAISEEFSRNVRMDYDRQSPSQNYSNSFSYPAQENMSFAVIDTSGDFSPVRRFDYQHRSFQARSNKQWYENTWNTASDGFMQQSDSPSPSPQQYEPMSVDNRFAGHRHNQQRWNRRYHRNPSNRRNPSGRSKFRSFHHPSPYRHAPRTVNFQEETTEYDWQNIRKVSENAESWSHFKKLISGKNCEEPSVEPKQEIPMKVEENDDGAVKVEENNDAEEEEEEEEEEGEEEPQVDSLDEEAEEEDVEWKPLLQPSDCTDIGSILQKLNIFKEVVCDKVHIAHSETRLKINYDIYLPTTKFKKSSPCVPDYRLCVVGCEEEVPSAGEISFLLKELRNDIPVPLLFAVVVPDSVSFYHFVNISLPVDDSCPA